MKRGREEFDRRILRRATDHAALVDRFQWIFLPRYEYPLLIQHSHGIDVPSIDGLPIKNGDFPWLC